MERGSGSSAKPRRWAPEWWARKISPGNIRGCASFARAARCAFDRVRKYVPQIPILDTCAGSALDCFGVFSGVFAALPPDQFRAAIRQRLPHFLFDYRGGAAALDAAFAEPQPGRLSGGLAAFGDRVAV